MDKVAQLASSHRGDLFVEAAARRGNISAWVMEKDFWVCWILRILFDKSFTTPGLIFKGGTSLSKVYHIIHRFSEDIDLSIDRKGLGFDRDREPMTANSRKQAVRLIAEMQEAAIDYIQTTLVPALTDRVVSALGIPKDSAWSLEMDPADRQTILFRYPGGVYHQLGSKEIYIEPAVRIELGCRGEFWPSEEQAIQCYAAETIPELFTKSTCQVHVLSVQRTFWEKATILHAEYHRPATSHTRPRLARHYYDMALLSQSQYCEQALKDLDLLAAVAQHKQVFFHSGWAQYASACPGTLHLSPVSQRIPELRQDYQAMREMFFGNPPGFADILTWIAALEKRINDLSV